MTGHSEEAEVRRLMCRVADEAMPYQADFWPRDHGKSEIFCIDYPLRRICEDPNVRVLIVQKTGTEAAKTLQAIKTELESNAPLKSYYAAHWLATAGHRDISNATGVVERRGRREGAWQQYRIYVKRTRRGKDPTVEAVGVGGAITGGHFDVIILDDVEDDENTRTEERLGWQLSWFNGTILQLREPHTKTMTLIRPILRWGSSPPPPPAVDNFVRVLVGDATGRILTELEIDVGPVAWRLNKISKLPLEIAATDPLATRDHLRFGNRILVQFRNGLPDWGGVIEPPRRWKDGAIQFTAYSAEELLRRWLTDKARTFTAASAGQLYQGLITDATALAGVNVAIGDVWQGGKSYSPEYHLDGVLEKVQRQLVDSYGVDFYISASESEGYI